MNEERLSKWSLESEGESNCCGASVYGETDICSRCKEHCEVIVYEDEDIRLCTEEEWEAEQEHQQRVDLGLHDDDIERAQ